MAHFGYSPKLKKDLRLAFSAHFQHQFSIKMFLDTLSIDKVQCYIFFVISFFQTKCVVKLLFKQFLTSLNLSSIILLVNG